MIFPENYGKSLLIGAGISLVFSAIVFVSAIQFTNPSYAFYSALISAIAGILLLPLAIGNGAFTGEEHQGKEGKHTK